ncbi:MULTISPECIES: hypothetical protein [Streptomyces]|uniref:Uncharacterized protein n=1 Tax=Streptomyces tremellae TaxID=1124239 RepID=A0ABP7GBH5_9ACTN|nr:MULTISPECIES: hypothetical protein [Streptomyces]MBO1286169.1 hypothetical protein [Streptomyces sampsonii]
MSTPPGFHRVKSHLRRNPTAPAAKKGGVWIVLGVLAALYLAGQADGQEPPEQAPAVTQQGSR